MSDINKLNNLVLEIETMLTKENLEQNKKIILDTFKKDNPNLIKKYSGIFVILENSTNIESIERLKFMLNMAIKVKENDILEHDASVAVGQRLVDDIVKPQLNK